MRLDISKNNIIITKDDYYEIYGESKEHNIVIKSDATILLEDLNINVIGKYKPAIAIENLSKVKLILRGSSSLTSDENHAGLEIIGKNDITLKAEDSTCNINIISGASSAGIGAGNKGNFEGNLTIEEGIINITSTRDGAGIGGGNGGNGGGNFLGNLDIYGGIINITLGSGGGAGIGGGSFGSLIGKVNIYGGSISCVVKQFGIGAGIGGGYDGNLDGKVIINDGVVSVQGGEGSAGIGGGIRTKNGGALNGEVIINGGNTKAYGGSYNSNQGGAGIGSGYGGEFNGDIDLNRGNITAYGPGNANDIGSGTNGQDNGNINVKVKSIAIIPSYLELKIGESRTVKTKVTVEADINAQIPDYEKVVYTSKDNRVATVDNDGLITAIGYGYTEIIATSAIDNSKYDICYINIEKSLNIIGEINMIINVEKNQIPEDELDNIICYGNNPIISYKYSYDDIKDYNVSIKIPQCSNEITALANYKSIMIFFTVNYSIVLYSNDRMGSLVVYALEFDELSTTINFCVGVDEEIDISKFNIVVMPKYEIDKSYSNKYYLFKISGNIGIEEK